MAVEKSPEEAQPPPHPADEAWEYLDRVTRIIDDEPDLELVVLEAAKNRLIAVGHFMRDDEKSAWNAIGNLLIRLISRRRQDEEAAIPF